MNNVKEHYEKHLANFYSWMAGDFTKLQVEHQQFLETHKIKPLLTKVALDLGAGHGLQSVSLAHVGFSVTAIDINIHLLTELKINGADLKINTVKDDIRNVSNYKTLKPELIICWGDTLTHLENGKEIDLFLKESCEMLPSGGKILLSFRDYAQKLNGDERFIPVKSDENRILTCFLEYLPTQVRVTDLLHEKTKNGWQQKISSYYKFRISQDEVIDMLLRNKMKIEFCGKEKGMIAIIGVKN
ncbi:MAG: methyltransferase domain-containing protein [bacterium]|nr:methyltransferase domain-containing protein [bacterium]